MQQAVLKAGRQDDVLAFRDDLSCGPICSDDYSIRVDWWDQFYEASEVREALTQFWERIARTDERIVLWFSRNAANELAFFLACAERLGERQYAIVDATEHHPSSGQGVAPVVANRPFHWVSTMAPDQLSALFGTELQITTEQRQDAISRWRQLKMENAPFRIVSPLGLISAPIDFFDALLLERVSTKWKRIVLVIGETLGYNSQPYHQVGHGMLLMRVVAMVEEGRLEVQGDPWDMRSSLIRLPASK